MSHSRHELTPGVWLDSRRALYLEAERVLCIADPHIGYVWAHRQAGQMMPVVSHDDCAARLQEICADYSPSRTVVLGDVVHRALPKSEVQRELAYFIGVAAACAPLTLILGNHDRGIAALLDGSVDCQRSLKIGEYALLHGDAPLENTESRGAIIGHEHPAISLGDGVRHAKFPCFVAGPELVILPAFSQWAAGADITSGDFMSEWVRQTEVTDAVVIMGKRLLRLKLEMMRLRRA